MTRSMLRQDDGFTLTELLVSTAIMMTVTAGVFTVIRQAAFFRPSRRWPTCSSVCAWASIR